MHRFSAHRRLFLERGSLAAAGALLADPFSHLLAQAPATPTRVVETSAGRVRGLRSGKVNVFRGIPYGASTAGAGRFMPPRKPAPWAGVRDAFEFGPWAPQGPSNLVPEYGVMELLGPTGEDCLVLNVWTPGTGGGRRPVMVYFHGGGLVAGSGATTVYGGANLAAAHDVVVVTLNHRLNVFGFMHLADLDGGEQFAHSTNLGLLDLVAALEWVRDNIAQFGGDPGNVTIFGQSGGGRKVTALLGMPSAQGLYRRAIAQSASTVTGLTREAATKSAEALLTTLGLGRNEVSRLTTIPADTLVEAMTKTRGLDFLPVMDGRTLPAHPFDPVASALAADVPLMVGSTETEVTWNINTSYDPLDEAGLRSRVAQAVRIPESAADRVIARYKQGRPRASNLDLALIVASDASFFRTSTDVTAERKAAQPAPVYKYYFQWYSPVREGKLRAMHTMELPFVFNNVDIARTEVGTGPERQPLADRMSGAWSAFARTGDPNHAGLPNWVPFTVERRATMVFNNECRLDDDPYGDEKRALTAAITRG